MVLMALALGLRCVCRELFWLKLAAAEELRFLDDDAEDHEEDNGAKEENGHDVLATQRPVVLLLTWERDLCLTIQVVVRRLPVDVVRQEREVFLRALTWYASAQVEQRCTVLVDRGEVSFPTGT